MQDKEIQQFKAAWEASGIRMVVAHDSYLINLATPDDALLEKSRSAMRIEVERCEQLGIPYLVMHPGSHVGSGEEAGLRRVAESFDAIHRQTAGFQAKILVETTAGQGTNLGWQFEQIARIFEHVAQPERLGVCFDTCHAFAAGYDIRTEAAYRQTMAEFDRIIGLARLNAIHVNDSVKPLGCRVDRHEAIGKGHIGLDGFRWLMNDPRLADIPKILETPKGGDPVASDQENLSKLRALLETEAR